MGIQQAYPLVKARWIWGVSLLPVGPPLMRALSGKSQEVSRSDDRPTQVVRGGLSRIYRLRAANQEHSSLVLFGARGFTFSELFRRGQLVFQIQLLQEKVLNLR